MACILVIDPSSFCRVMMASVLEGQGYQVSTCGLEDAATVITRVDPALLIVELGPTERDGLVFVESVRRTHRWKDLPIVAVTDLASKPAVLQAGKLGIRDYMLKSRFTLAELLSRVGKHMARSAEQRAVETTPEAAVHPTGSPTPEEDREAIRDAASAIGIPAMRNTQMLQRVEKIRLKAVPSAVADLVAVIASPRGNSIDLAVFLKRDPAIAKRVLDLSNAPGIGHEDVKNATLEDAMKVLGQTAFRNLAISAGIFETFITPITHEQTATLARCWEHALAVGMLMEKLTPDCAEAPPGTAFVVGLCHDLADVALRQYFAPQFEYVLTLAAKTGRPQRQIETVVFGMPYDELALLLMSKLGLPPVITAPIQEFFERAVYKRPSGSGSVLGRTLRITNVYAHGLRFEAGGDEPIVPLSHLECSATFGESMPNIDDAALRAQVLAMAGAFYPSDAAKPPELPAKSDLSIGYIRHGEYAMLDPLHSLLTLSGPNVTLIRGFPADLKELTRFHALIIAAPRSTPPADASRQIKEFGDILGGESLNTLYLSGLDANGVLECPPNVLPLRLPINCHQLASFLAKPAAQAHAKAA